MAKQRKRRSRNPSKVTPKTVAFEVVISFGERQTPREFFKGSNFEETMGADTVIPEKGFMFVVPVYLETVKTRKRYPRLEVFTGETLRHDNENLKMFVYPALDDETVRHILKNLQDMGREPDTETEFLRFVSEVLNWVHIKAQAPLNATGVPATFWKVDSLRKIRE